MAHSADKYARVSIWVRKVFRALRLSPEDKQVAQTVIGLENIRRVLYLSLIAIPTSASYFLIFMLKAVNETGVAYQWRQAIWICHAVIFISFSVICALLYFYSYRPAKYNQIARICIHLTVVILLLEGAALAAADQLVTSNITPYLITCLVAGLIILIPPLQAFFYFASSYLIFHFAISLTQRNTEILISNQINGITAAAIGICLSVILWRGYLIRTKQSKLIEKQNIRLKKALDLVNSQKDDVERLSRIGRDITSSLSIENIIRTIYENVNTLMDASVFTIGLHKPEEGVLAFPSAIEKKKMLPSFTVSLADASHLAARCFNRHQEVIINDCSADCGKGIGLLTSSLTGKTPMSLLYLPLWKKDKAIGVISAQSRRKNAYSDYHVNMLRNLAAYIAIALENADAYRQLTALLDELKATQDKLVTQSKLAALGALTAGIAHEIKNPLNFINNFAELTVELVDEVRQAFISQNESLEADTRAGLDDLLTTLQSNAKKIKEHGKRADSIVRSMLQHSRGTSGERQRIDINAILTEDINLTYHGMRAQDSSFNIKIETDLDPAVGSHEVVPQNISRVFLNILANGCYEANRKKKTAGENFTPTISVRSRRTREGVEVRIRDNGNGIPEAIRDKVLMPFFTTKPTGQGTGLGLSISYEIVTHEHKGRLTFESVEGEYTEFVILLPGE